MSTLDITDLRIFLDELAIEGQKMADAEAEVKRLQILIEKLENRFTAHKQYVEVLKANPIDDEDF